MILRHLLLLTAAPLFAQADWQYGGTAAGTRYSPLKQITRENVARLREVWRYDVTPPAGGPARPGLQTQPVVIGGVVYGNTPAGAVFAIDGATGKPLWTWDSKAPGQRVRGYTYWTDGKDARLFAGVGRYVYALNAKTGAPIDGFGAGGRIDLHQDLGRDPEKQSVSLTTPGIV
jgi:quinoprotein glucose dehydrogenase